MATAPVTPTDPILEDLKTYFDLKEAFADNRLGDHTNYQDRMIAAENRLRKYVGAPIVARKSRH